MTIRKNILTMNDAELASFIEERRVARSLPSNLARRKKTTIEKLAKELGYTQKEITERIKKELKA